MKAFRIIMQEKVNDELLNMFVEMSNSNITNRPTAEDKPQLSVEERVCMNQNICIFRKHR